MRNIILIVFIVYKSTLFITKKETIVEYVSTTEIAKKWNISRRRVTTLCREGRIKGAIFTANTWIVPEDAKKPEDPRKAKKKLTTN